ncbi:MAG: NAD(P)/FAD-dependent oxidoreductase [Methanothrix sp.]|nr:NAD(P)/FAD-dependent oxidoreductase [Methanothrix sp.]
MKRDLIVIGAGPGGSMAAKTAAEAGLDVFLLEKRQEIGEPIRCAEGVSIRSELKELIDVEPSWISTEIQGARMHSPNGDSIFTTGVKGEGGGYILDRKIFDRGLATRAARSGALVMVKTRATGLTRKDGQIIVSAVCQGERLQIEAPLVIGADGVESKVARWAGMDSKMKPEDIMVCAQFLVLDEGIDPDYCEFFFGNLIAPGGYIWIFPKGDGRANVGIGLQGSRSGPGMPVRLLESFIQKRMPKAKVLQMMAGGIPTSGPMKSITSDGVMLVGDAAHQSDPLTGGGIINAMRAGVLAGQAAARAVSTEDASQAALREYEGRWKSSFGKQLVKSYNAKKFFLSLDDDDFNHLVKSLYGRDISSMHTKDLLRFLFRQNPKLLWNMRNLMF